jgi:hypothetical protein
LLVLAMAGQAQATITVANGNDSGAGSLREAVATAPPGEVIVLPAGTYTLTSGTLMVEKSLTIEGHSSADTTIRAGGAFGVIMVPAGPLELNLADLTIRDGNIVASSATGAGILSISAELNLDHVSVTHNTVNANGAPGVAGGSASGAGLAVISGSLELLDSSVSENTASAVGGSGKGGGAVSGGGIFAGGKVKIVNSTVSNNVADARGGQGPSNAGQNGGAISGGGFFNVTNAPNASRIVASTIADNSADVSGGPGGNGGAVSGAGVFEVANAAPTTYLSSTIAANAVHAGGAAGGAASGGGIFVVANAPVSFFNTTIAINRIEGAAAMSGGNAFLANQTRFKNSIVAGGTAKPGTENCFAGPAPTSFGFNVDSLNQCGFGAAGDKVNTDPLLGPLQDNGGPTPTMAPAGNSPAVDQGNSVGLVDQRGVVRPIDFPSIPNSQTAGADGSDIGAVELQPSNAFTLGKVTKNKKKGTATVAVTIPTPSVGTLTLSGSGLKKQTVAITGQSTVKLKIATKGGTAKSLRKKGKKKVKFEVTYAPTANAAASKARSTTLKRKHRAKKKH